MRAWTIIPARTRGLRRRAICAREPGVAGAGVGQVAVEAHAAVTARSARALVYAVHLATRPTVRYRHCI